jgi:thymidylate synthase (FAD)
MKIAPMKVELIDSMGSDLSVVNAARVSFHKESDYDTVLNPDKYGDYKEVLNEKDQKLISYLARHGHWTPFGHAFLSYRIKAPVFVARQLVKHQVGLVWNEVSRRYVDEEPEVWFPNTYHARPASTIKQGASDESHSLAPQYLDRSQRLIEASIDLYNDMITDGIAPEEARIVLPLNSMTEWIWSGSLAAFARVCKLRLAKQGVQGATKEIAQEIYNGVPEQFQHSWKALMA